MTPVEWAAAAFGVIVLIMLYRIAQDVEAIKEHLAERDDADDLDDA